MAETNDNPAFAEVNNSLRKAWSQKITVNNPVAAARDIAPLLVRLRSAAHVAVFGPALAGHQHCNAVMWDANTFTGHQVAFEAAELIYDVLERCVSALNAHEVALVNVSDALRRSRHYENNPRPAVAAPENFTSLDNQTLVTSNTEVTLVRGGSDKLLLRFDPRTGRLLCVVVPFGMRFEQLDAEINKRKTELMEQLHQFDSCQLGNLPYTEAMRSLIFSSLADLASLLLSDAACLQQFCADQKVG